MRSTFRNTTAIIAAFSLAIPTIAPAQQTAEVCEADDIAITADLATAIELDLSDAQRAALDAGASEEFDVAIVNDTPVLCMSIGEMEEMGASPDQIAMALDAHEMTTDLTAEAEAEVAEDSNITAESTEPADGVEMLEQDAETASEETAQDEAEPPVSDTTGNTTEAEVEVENEAEAEAVAEAAPETEAEAIAEAAPEADVDPQTDNAVEQALNAADEAVSDVNELAEQELAKLQEAIEAQSAEEADPVAQAEAAEEAAPTESAAADDTAEAAEIEEETITEADARSSSEEFEGEMDTTMGATLQSGNDGLSDFEKALLVGLGAVVVGKALKDNSDAQVVSKSNDRVVVLEDGRYRVIRDDNELIERPGSTVRRERFEDGSTRTVVTREDGVRIMTIRDPELRVLRRVRIDVDGNQTVLIDDTTDYEPVDVATLPEPVESAEFNPDSDAEALRKALDRANRADRRFALYQVRSIERVRKLAPAIQLDAINFRTGSAVIEAQEAEELADLGNLIADYIDKNPGEIFLIEGHTDAVGDAAYNLALSDRRAESVALALTEYFDVPPENLVVQGYGESDLKIRTLDAERANRRAAVRRITPLIASGS